MQTGSQYLTGRSLGIDELLFREAAGMVGTVVPGRMSPLTVIGFSALGAGALLASLGTWRRATIGLATGAIVIAMLNIADYVFGAGTPSFLAGYTQMAVNTALAIAILGFGVIGLLGRSSPFAMLEGHATSAVLLRRLLVVSVAVPVMMTWIRLEGQRLGLYDTSYGASLMLVGTVGISVFAIFRFARWAREVDQRREASELERDRFFELSLDMLSVVDSNGVFRRVNRAWEATLGYPADELVGRPFMDLVHPDDRTRTIDETERHYGRGEKTLAFQNRYRHRDGTYRWLEWMSQTSPDRGLAFAVARDERKAEEARRVRQRERLEARTTTLAERAERDGLTGLHNRRHFDAAIDRLESRWRRLGPDGRPPVGIVIFDLDHFGRLNKEHGPQVGDAVLRLFADILRKRFRSTDLVARYGGEEFVAILEGSTATDAAAIAEQVRIQLEQAETSVGPAGSVRATVSAGCAQLGDDADVAAALTVADVWLSQAKRAGRNQVVGLPSPVS